MISVKLLEYDEKIVHLQCFYQLRVIVINFLNGQSVKIGRFLGPQLARYNFFEKKSRILLFVQKIVHNFAMQMILSGVI